MHKDTVLGCDECDYIEVDTIGRENKYALTGNLIWLQNGVPGKWKKVLVVESCMFELLFDVIDGF